eukprot:CAMPEP_0182812408 /NCGR_PEP_ID=MMETSP0006_2-20121128/8790_1 /TAXON_ID=97485 /ORGANISM="Prymnesium parvum, Strain Texoma1" /LENGTH=50 /DNA_ID=CAMNT_0024938435 /DNA_START=589 /DNA_END=738 /DNA_ORIENTATION=+
MPANEDATDDALRVVYGRDGAGLEVLHGQRASAPSRPRAPRSAVASAPSQ